MSKYEQNDQGSSTSSDGAEDSTLRDKKPAKKSAKPKKFDAKSNTNAGTKDDAKPVEQSSDNKKEPTYKEVTDGDFTYKIPVKSKDAQKNIVRIPRGYPNKVKVWKSGVAKCKTRVAKFTKDGVPRLKKDGTFKYGFTTSRKIINAILALLVAALLAAGAYGVYFYLSAQNNLNQGTVIGSLADAVIKEDPLQTDEYGRTNILVFGTSEDDEGHGGADLADSIMVLSINPKTGAANSISIPRDLTYKEKNYKTMCSMGSIWKINVAYMCGYERSLADDSLQKQRDGSEYMKSVIEDVTGLDIQYYAKANYSVLIGVVDSIGGIDITPYSDGGKGLYDVATKIKLPGNQVSHLDGFWALALSRARNDAGGYGLSRSNFDREINQQIILNAIKEKASTSGVLLNPAKLLDLTQALGDNIVTNIKTSEFKSLGKAANMMRESVTLPLLGDTPDGLKVQLVTTGTSKASSGLGSVVLPTEGEFEFDDIAYYIREYIDKKITVKVPSSEECAADSTLQGCKDAVIDSDDGSAHNGNYIPQSERKTTSRSKSSTSNSSAVN